MTAALTKRAPCTAPPALLRETAGNLHVTVTRKALSDALGLLERVIPTRSSNPLLTALKVDSSDLGLRLSGTNLELDLECFVPAEVDHPASFAVPAHLFAQIVRNLGGDPVQLHLQGTELSIQAAGGEFKLQTGDLAAYPPLSFPTHADVSLDSGELSQALSSVRYAASSEASQAVFRGIKLEHGPASVRVIASDGYRVAMREFPTRGEGQSLIIPARNADELVRVLKGGEARFTYGEGLLTVTTDRVRLNLKLLDGDYPDDARVIPNDFRVDATLSAARLREAVNRVAVLADKSANNRVEFLISEGQLRLAAEGDYGRAQDILEVTQGGLDPAISLAFNARHVLDALGPIEGDVKLLCSSPLTPAILRPSGGGSYQAVIVTLRV